MSVTDLYRGYVECKGKKAIQEFKDPEIKLLTLQEAQSKPSYGGVLRDNTVMVDVDNMAEAEILRKILDVYDIKARITKTRRGMHFTFFTNDVLQNLSHLESAIGIVCDYKYGINNSYEVLKVSGKEREVISDPKVISTIPRWLYPRSDKPTDKRDNYENIVGLSSGSRDDTLHRWTTSNCKRSSKSRDKTMFNVMAGISQKDFEDMFTIINRYIFEEPLDDKEFSKFISDAAREEKSGFATKNQKKAKTDEVRPLVDELMEKAEIRQFGNTLYRKVDGKYYRILNTRFVNNELIIKREMSPEKQRAAQTLIEAHIQDDMIPYSTNRVGFRNGVFDWRTLEFKPYDHDDVIFRYFDINYKEETDCTFVEGILKDWCEGNEDKYKMLLELAGCCFYSDRPIKKWWVIEGKADTGKSTFLRILREIVGPNSVGSTPIQNLKDSNAIAELVEKPVNIVDDGSSLFTTDLSNLRRIIQGDDMQIKVLYENRFTVRIESRMVFAFNEIPRFRDNNNATAKKMMVLRFNRVYSDEEKDTELLDKLTTEQNKEAFLSLAIGAMKEVIKRNLTFTISEESRQTVEEIVKESDQFQSFISDLVSDDFDWKAYLNNKETTAVYEEFKKWAAAEGYNNRLVQRTFSKKIISESGAKIRKSNGKRFYYFENSAFAVP